jgi:PD-(D/E)XK nuclease superfamily
MNDQYRLYHFFSVLREKRRAFAENYNYFAPKLAPRFNSFAFIRPDEMKLSEILAALLNPNHSHAQGETFLKLFFAELGISYPQHCSNIKVDCEVSTKLIENNYRRIDIVVNFDDKYGLAIENKPWASDQYQQLSDYAKEMKNKFGDNSWSLVYLSGSSSNPNENSISHEQLEELESKGYFKGSHFGQLVEWLKKCEAQCQADHVRHFLRDFVAYCENEFLEGTNMIDANLVKDFALQQGENLELALAVGQQIISIKEVLLNAFMKDLKNQLAISLPSWELKYKKDFNYRSSKWSSIRFYKPEWKNYSLAIEFQKDHCDGLVWGIRKNDAKIANLPEITLKELEEKLKERGRKSSQWPWYCYFSSPYCDWSRDSEPWLEIQSGKQASIMQKIKLLADAYTDVIDAAEKSMSIS